MRKHPVFLFLVDIMEIHANQLELYGGLDGVRDLKLLQSALAQPEATLDGAYLHQDLYEMAAAYAFHICQNHPFLDGNKRTALASALVFLEINGVSVRDPTQRLLPAMLKLAKGQLTKLKLADILRQLSTKRVTKRFSPV